MTKFVGQWPHDQWCVWFRNQRNNTTNGSLMLWPSSIFNWIRRWLGHKNIFNQFHSCEVPVQKSPISTPYVPRNKPFIPFSSNVQSNETLLKPEMSASDQKEKIWDKPSPRTSDPVTISSSSKDSIKSLPSIEITELKLSTRVRKPVDRLNYSFFKGWINIQMLMSTYELMLMFCFRLGTFKMYLFC